MPGWASYRDLVKEEFTQSTEEGRDAKAVEALRPEFEAAGDDQAKLTALWNKILALPIRADYPFVEPNDLVEIKRNRN